MKIVSRFERTFVRTNPDTGAVETVSVIPRMVQSVPEWIKDDKHWDFLLRKHNGGRRILAWSKMPRRAEKNAISPPLICLKRCVGR